MARALWILSVVASLFVLVSFALFAMDQFGGASERQQQTIELRHDPNAPAARRAGQPRRFIDDVAESLRSPFDSIVSSSSAWAREGVPTFVALLVYGFGLGFLARYARARN